MKFGLSVNIFESEVHVLDQSKNSVTLRTNDVIPFTGDYEIVTVDLCELQNDDVMTLAGVDTDAEQVEFFEYRDGNNMTDYDVRELVYAIGLRKLNKLINRYITSILSDRSTEMGHTSFTNIYL